MKLRELQTHLQTHLLTDDLAIMQHVVEPQTDSSEARLLIYNNAYHGRLLEALEKTYAVLQHYLGDDVFFEMGYAYIAVYPSHYFSIDRFTENLSQFLAATNPYKQQPYLSELAHFISALSETITAADAPVLTTDDIAKIPPEAWSTMRLQLHPSVELITYHWNVHAIWQSVLAQQEPPVPTSQTELGHYVVWRKGIESFYELLNTQEASMLQALQQGLTFAEMCEQLTQWLAPEAVAQYAVNILIRWLNNGMLSEVTL